MNNPITDEFLSAALERARKVQRDDHFRYVTALVLAEVFERLAPWIAEEQRRHREKSAEEK